MASRGVREKNAFFNAYSSRVKNDGGGLSTPSQVKGKRVEEKREGEEEEEGEGKEDGEEGVRRREEEEEGEERGEGRQGR